MLVRVEMRLELLLTLSLLAISSLFAFPLNYNAAQKKPILIDPAKETAAADSPGLSLIEWDDDMNVASELNSDN